MSSNIPQQPQLIPQQGYSSGQAQVYPPQQGYVSPQIPMQPQVGYMPPQVPVQQIPQPIQVGQPLVMFGVQYVFVQDPMIELANSIKAVIHQQVEIFEMISGCETANRYHVFVQNAQGMSQYLFKCKEESGWCMRNCCPSSGREFNMKLKHINMANQLNTNDFSNTYANLFKPYKCTCFCLARPELLLSLHGNQQQYIGKVKEEFTCCDPLFTIKDGNGTPVFIITCDCCQCGFCCRNNFCGKLSEVKFSIFDVKNQSGAPVGSIVKRVAQNAGQLFSDADSYDVNFPVNSSPQEKFSLICCALMIDYQYFEQTGSSNNGGGGIQVNF